MSVMAKTEMQSRKEVNLKPTAHDVTTRNMTMRLRNREYSNQQQFRTNMDILKTLITSDDYEFKNILNVSSKKKIATADGKLYLDYYSRCFSSFEANTYRFVYNNPALVKIRIEDAIIISSPTDLIRKGDNTYKPCIFALTRNNYFLRIDASTGEVYDRIYLSSTSKFIYLDHDQDSNVISLRSTQENDKSGVSFTLALFGIFPLKLIGVLEITDEIFGKGVTCVGVSQGLLFVSNRVTKTTTIYSMDSIIEHHTKFPVELYTRNKVTHTCIGRHPDPLPINITLTETPPEVCQVPFSSADTPPELCQVPFRSDVMSIGGHPWHALYCPDSTNFSRELRDLITHEIPIDGKMNFDSYETQPEHVSFFEDDSNRLYHIAGNIVRIYELKETEDGKKKLAYSHCISASPPPTPKVKHKRHNYREKRCIQLTKFPLFMSCVTQHTYIDGVDYDDDLNLLCITSTYHPDAYHLRYHICDNVSTKVLKIIPLGEYGDGYADQDVTMDNDVIVHRVTHHNKQICSVLRLQRCQIT